jgi:hypothetical protein
MAYATNYATIKADLITYTVDDSTEFLAQMDSIIARGVDDVQLMLDLEMFRETVATHVSFASRQFSRPAALKINSFFFPDLGDFAQKRSYDFCRSYLGSGIPVYWAEQTTSKIYLAPTPSQNFTVEVDYLARMTPLSDASPTNWITDNAGDILLLACLAESEQFLKAPERMQEFVGTMKMKVQMLQNSMMGQGRPDYTPMRAAPQASGAL